jgi:NAD+ diphosphatase
LTYFFRDPTPELVLSAQPHPEGTDPLLFAFRKEALVHIDDPFTLPTLGAARRGGVPVETVVPLGAIDGKPAVLAALAPRAELPSPFRASSVRRLLMSLEGPMLAAAAIASQLAHFEATTRFCGSCGGRLAPKPSDRAKRCDACDREVYPQVAPCVIVLVHDGDRVLLARAGRLPPGMFALIAGFVEPGETLEACVRREVKEEVGLDVDDIRYVASQPWPFPSQLMVGFLARATGGELCPEPSEIEEARWFSVHELPLVPPPFSVARFLIDSYVAERKKAAP